MGFGICLIANALFLFDIFGLDVIAFALFGYAFALLAETDKFFMKGAYISIGGLVPSILRVLNIFGILKLSRFDFSGLLIQSLSSALLIGIYSILFFGVKRIAKANDAKKLAVQADVAVRLSFGALSLFIASSIAFHFIGDTIPIVPTLAGLSFILRYVTIIIMTIYIYFSYASITTPSLLRKEEKADAKLAEKELKTKTKNNKKE